MATNSIQTKLRLLMMLASAILLLLACGAFIAADRSRAGRAVKDDLSSLAGMIAASSAAPLAFEDHEAGTEVLSALKARPAVIAAVMYTRAGHPMAIYGNPEASLLRGIPAPRSSGDRIEVVRSVVLDGETVGSIYIASDLSDAAARTRRFAVIGLTILIMSLCAAWPLAHWLEHLITRPIVKLAAMAQLVSRHSNYSLRASAPASGARTDEVGALVHSFNQMLAEIQRRDDDLRRHQDELELQVQTRTTELRSVNANLIDAKELAERVAEINARLSNQQKMILNAAGEGILGLDEGGTITFINPSGAAMFNEPVEGIAGRQLHALIHPGDAEAVGFDECPMCNLAWPEGARWSRTHTFLRRDGVRLPIELTASAIVGDDGRRSGVVITFRDVTERLAVERMKDEFVSTVSHELRTPLTSIRGALGLLGSGLLGDAGDRARRMLDIAVTNTDRLVRLIDEILDLERMKSGKVDLNRTAIEADRLMQEAIEVVQPVAEEARVHVSMCPTSAVVYVDHDRIVQTLTNLLGNAVKFSACDTSVVVTGRVEGDHFRFSVRDQGRGIPADKLDTVFERFKQVDASDSREKAGTGLGLAICRTIVAAHGGRIWVESRENEGSTFHFTVPMPPAGEGITNTTSTRTVVCSPPGLDNVTTLEAEGAA